MRLSEVIELRWDRVDLDAMTLTVEETETGEPLAIPVARQLNARIGEAGGAKFRFHALRNYFITVADWLRDAARRIAERIDELAGC